MHKMQLTIATEEWEKVSWMKSVRRSANCTSGSRTHSKSCKLSKTDSVISQSMTKKPFEDQAPPLVFQLWSL